MKLKNLLLWILVWQVPLWIGAPIARGGMDWYHGLAQPFFSPPDWLFGMVWAVLYILLALSGFCITRKGFDNTNRKAVWLMIVQLILNALWTPLFFGMHYVAGAMVLILLMIGMTVWLMSTIKNISRTATWLLVPYVAWLCFAWTLNTAIWMMN